MVRDKRRQPEHDRVNLSVNEHTAIIRWEMDELVAELRRFAETMKRATERIEGLGQGDGLGEEGQDEA